MPVPHLQIYLKKIAKKKLPRVFQIYWNTIDLQTKLLGIGVRHVEEFLSTKNESAERL